CLLLPEPPSRLLGVSLIASPTAAACFGVTVSSATTSAALLFLLTKCEFVVPLRIGVVRPGEQDSPIGFECRVEGALGLRAFGGESDPEIAKPEIEQRPVADLALTRARDTIESVHRGRYRVCSE